ncbi:MAG TPA: very short patch repair endonuclease [Bacteroidia bacterium]|nr:very short patch repair endonuclease [Bacteroidia bacterium]
MPKLHKALTRSEMMARIRSKDTRPELRVRHFLWASGFRYRLHGKQLPGKPDIVLSRYKTVVFVHGCFWHGHANCKQFKLPATRREFWEAKITTNQTRDAQSISKLKALGWNVIVVWECEISGQAGRARLVRLLSEILGIEGM